jgi:hypothetical protein
MVGTTEQSRKFMMSVKSKCRDYSEFDQTAYIKEALHDRLPTDSPYINGVCGALCVYLLIDWIKNNKGKSRKLLVDQFVGDCNDRNSDRPTIEVVNTYKQQFLAAPGTWDEKYQAFMAKNVPNKPKHEMATNIIEAAVKTSKLGCTLIALGTTVTKTAHAMLCDGKSNTCFDPNVGYYQANDDIGYLDIFEKMLEVHGKKTNNKSQSIITLSYIW